MVKMNNNLLIKDKKIIFYKSYTKLLKNNIYLYNFYISKLFFNNFKFNTHNLLTIKKILNFILKKKIILNISNIKYIYNNNNLLLKVLTNKINKYRKKSVLRLIRNSIIKAKVAKLNSLFKIKTLKLYIDNLSKKNFKFFLKKNKEIYNSIFYGSYNLHLLGLKIEAKGRITKRLTASRSMRKINYKGSLINAHSNINKNSTFKFKGFEKSNINYINYNNYNILGTYGLKY
jgi:hypothetical protein